MEEENAYFKNSTPSPSQKYIRSGNANTLASKLVTSALRLLANFYLSITSLLALSIYLSIYQSSIDLPIFYFPIISQLFYTDWSEIQHHVYNFWTDKLTLLHIYCVVMTSTFHGYCEGKSGLSRKNAGRCSGVVKDMQFKAAHGTPNPWKVHSVISFLM